MKPKKFAQSKELQGIVKGHDWLLYDVTLPEDRETAWTWEEIQRMKPTKAFEMGHQYMFVPKPQNGQTLRDAYAVTKGLGPAIVVSSIDDHVDMDGEGPITLNDKLVYIFTRMLFEDMLLLTSPRNIVMPRPPKLVIPYRSVVPKFEKYFKIVTPEEMNVDPDVLQKPCPSWFNANPKTN